MSLLNSLRGWVPSPAPAERLAAVRMGTGLYALWYISTRFDMLIRMNSSDRSLYDPIGILSWMESPMEPLTFCILLLTCIGLNTVSYTHLTLPTKA